MSNYRITKGNGYNGCEPITVYWVQRRRKGYFSDTWINIKGFELYSRAKEALDLLDGDI